MKKNIFNIFLFITFCFTAALAGADNENWLVLESANDLEGRWEGNLTINIPENLNEMVPRSSMDVKTIFEYSKNTRVQNNEYSLYMKIDFEKFLDDFIKMPELKMFGFSKDVIWDMFSGILGSIDEFPEYAFVIRKYYFEINHNGKIDELLNDSSQGQIFLNTGKNRMKWLFDSAVSLNLGDDKFMELILFKIEK